MQSVELPLPAMLHQYRKKIFMTYLLFFPIAFQDKIIITKKITAQKKESMDVQIFYVDEVLKALEKMVGKK